MFRTIWRYQSSFVGDFRSDVLRSAKDLVALHESAFDGLSIVGTAAAVFSAPKVALRRRLFRALPAFVDETGLDLAAYHHAFVTTREDADRLRERLLNTNGIANVEVQLRPSIPVWFRSREGAPGSPPMILASLSSIRTPNFLELQRYLNSAPEGVDAHHAWTVGGGRGDGVGIVDIEGGWDFQHEDLLKRQAGVIHGLNDGHSHGTAVLGVFSGDANGVGVTGIANEAVAMGASLDYEHALDPISGRSVTKWNAAGAIEVAVRRLEPGGVILLELQTPGPNGPHVQGEQRGCVPVEYWSAEYAAIRYATANGIHVVEAGGNGSEDLDAAVYSGLFDRRRRDSEAIVVGAGGSTVSGSARSTLNFSNYGSRLDVQGWGEDIVTAGGHSEPHYYDLRYDEDPARCYTQSFGGTSGASPMVAGAVACLSGALRAANRQPLPAAEMRRLLVESGSPQSGGGHIGPLPDLRRALGALGLR